MGVLILLMFASTTVFPSPMIHWLVWSALYAIVTARWEPLIHLDPVPAPPPGQWEFAYNLVLIGPAFIALGYCLGVSLGRRRARLQGSNGVRQPPPTRVPGSAPRLEDV